MVEDESTPVEVVSGETTTPNYVPEVGEHTGEVQPEVPAAVPATAEPAQDVVTVNTHLRKVAGDITEVVNYIKTHLSNHQAAEVVQDLEALAAAVNGLVQ